ncbi:MAG: FAD-dependent oxidoreductase [Peptoniphilaceae bacterium]|nr:FAD-dependent oxidoreductase [Peptoniphilaceae bacterium]
METLTEPIREEKKNPKNSKFLDQERGLMVKVPSDDYGLLTIPGETLSDLTREEKTRVIMRLKKSESVTEVLQKHAEGFDSVALASLRVMGTGFATGQAAGVIASVYCRDREIDVKKVQRILNDQDARI